MIVDLRRVEAGYDDAREEVAEQSGACLGQLVQHERTAGDLGEDGEQPGAGRGFQHPIGRRDRPRRRGREAKRDRRRELLERLALLGATRVGGEKARDLREHRQCGGRRPGFTEKRFAVFAEEQHRRRLAGVVGGFPIPGAGRIGGAEGRLHRGAQDSGVDAAATFEIGKEKPRGLGDGGGCSRKRWRSRRRAAAELEGFVMKETSGERERAEPPGALSRPDRLKPVPADLSLSSRRRLHGAPPRDARVARGIREPQQQIAVAGPRRAEADEIAAAKLVERAQEMMLIGKPALVLCDHRDAVAVGTDPERIAPFAAATDVDGARRHACMMLIENPAHRLRLLILKRRAGDRARF